MAKIRFRSRQNLSKTTKKFRIIKIKNKRLKIITTGLIISNMIAIYFLIKWGIYAS